MNDYKITFTLENGFKDEIIIGAANRLAAYENFTDIAKGFETKVIDAECVRV